MESPEEMISPCIGVCEVSAGVCSGCGRTLTQIARWTQYTEEERTRITFELMEAQGLAREAAGDTPPPETALQWKQSARGVSYQGAT